MSKSLANQDFDRHYPKVLEFQATVRRAARRALRTAEHDTEREAIRAALVRLGNLTTQEAKLYTDGPAQPGYINVRRKKRRDGSYDNRVAIRDVDGIEMWQSEVLEGWSWAGLDIAWVWLKTNGYVPSDSTPDQREQFGIYAVIGTVSQRTRL